MAFGFLDIARTPSVRAAEAASGSAQYFDDFKGDRASDRFTEAEAQFIAERDSFYVASVSETGWPYVQHRGGPRGFLKLIDDKTLAFADYRGNRQYITLGNATANDRVALFLMDYPNRRRLKIYAHIEERPLDPQSDLAKAVLDPGYKAKPERAFLLHLDAFDWNCPQHITPRYTDGEIEAALEPMVARQKQLEEENAALKARLQGEGKDP